MIRQRLKAEADGLTDKFKSMDHLSDTARAHEEFRMRLENNLNKPWLLLKQIKRLPVSKRMY
ncbi:hypothetical protein I3679_023085 [Proteus mirabilis]|uniref:Uncharacterized protein n=1 Tax=Proteus mirabilis TaxID=584 RepID=A0ABD5LWL5_PROMI